jgi:hypothetical protein
MRTEAKLSVEKSNMLLQFLSTHFCKKYSSITYAAYSTDFIAYKILNKQEAMLPTILGNPEYSLVKYSMFFILQDNGQLESRAIHDVSILDVVLLLGCPTSFNFIVDAMHAKPFRATFEHSKKMIFDFINLLENNEYRFALLKSRAHAQKF